MEFIDINSALTSIFVFVVTGFIAFIAHKITKFIKEQEKLRAAQERKEKQREEGQTAMSDGVRSLLRNELARDHRMLVQEKKSCTLSEKEIVERNYRSYHALGGNGIGTALFEEIMDLPIVDG